MCRLLFNVCVSLQNARFGGGRRYNTHDIQQFLSDKQHNGQRPINNIPLQTICCFRMTSCDY
jgi:hypothetical protein